MKVDFTKAMGTIQRAIPQFIGVVFGLTIGAVVVGVLLQQVTSGNIEVVSGIETFLTNWTTTIVSFFTSFGTAISVTIALLIVVVIVVLFGKYMSGSGGNGDRS